MRVCLSAAILALSSLPLLAQAPTPAPSAQPHSSPIGFSYSIPSDWEVVNTPPTLPDLKQAQAQAAATEEEKKGIGCVQISLIARHGAPASVVVVVGLPFDCFGQVMTDKDLPGFAEGASENLKQSLDLTEPLYGSYTLGAHSFWIERAKGSVKDHPEVKYTVETVCSVLKKGAVCWMAMAADEAALRTFENGAAKLDSDPPTALVPPTAFAKKP